MGQTYRLIALNLEVIATIILAIALLLVHKRMIREQSFDANLIKLIKIEMIFVYVAILFFIISFVLLLLDEVESTD